MKRFLLITFLFVVSIVSKSQITWDGGGDGVSWNDAANWVGNVVPGPGNDVLLDNSALAGNYTVTLPSGAGSVTIISLTITPGAGNTITLLLPTGNTVTADAFVTTGTGYTVVIDNGGVFDNNSGVTSGTNLTINDTMRINDGGRYIHRTRSGHGGWNSRLSRVAGTENGVFEFDVPGGSYILATSGNRQFGTLELSSDEAGGTQTYTSNAGGTLTINGDLNINTGVTYNYTPPAAGITFVVKDDCTISSTATFDLCTSGSNTMTFQIGGDLILNGTITENGSSLTTTLELNGTANQQISGTGSLLNSITFVMNNSAGATLNDPLTLPHNLTLTSGKITTTSTDLLTMVDDATYTGGSITSFISGPMKKIGDDVFSFPVGKGSIYAPIGISGGSGAATTDEFTAEYIRNNPQAVYGQTYAGGIDHISYAEYWTLDRVGAATKIVALDVHPTSFCLVPLTTFVSRWDGSQWTNEPSTPSGFATCGSYQCGTITTNAAITSFSPFTLATSDPFAINPLPIKLISFNAEKMGSSSAHISWELAECCSKDARFEIQKSSDGRNFRSFAAVGGNELSRYYFHNDLQLDKGITYYRLKMTDVDGTVTHSKVIAVINDSKGLLITSVAPNPVNENAVITLSAAKQGSATFEVYNMSGYVVKRWLSPIAEGNNTINVNMSELPAGLYHVLAYTPDTRTVLRFVKQ